MKIISFTVPCYNSQAYMRKCVDSLLVGGDDVEIIIVNDGSKDDTIKIANEYAERYPDIVKVVDKENGGHGSGINEGLKLASGRYFKVVDSDDWLDKDALEQLIAVMKKHIEENADVDLYITNFVYEHVEDDTQYVSRYTRYFPTDRFFGWNDTKPLRLWNYVLMHSLMYSTELLRKSGMILPEHTFYVDNIFVYHPLPYVKYLYYKDVNFYRYYIGRADQSVNESVMMGRVDQQLRVNYHMIDAWDLVEVAKTSKKLAKYMYNYLAMMMAISSIFLTMEGSPESLGKRTALWEYLRTVDKGLYTRMRYFAIPAATNLPTAPGRKLSVALYRLARRIYKFN